MKPVRRHNAMGGGRDRGRQMSAERLITGGKVNLGKVKRIKKYIKY
jgi:hypothetical protein